MPWSNVDGRLIRNTCDGTEDPPVQCRQNLRLVVIGRLWYML